MVAGMLLSGVSDGQDRTLDRRAVLEAVDSIATVVSTEYFDETVGQRAAAHLREFAAASPIADATPAALASIMTRELYAATRDKHLAVAATRLPATKSAPTSSEARTRRAAFENFGFRDVAILEGNIGYLDVRAFYRIDEARATLDAAMQFLAQAAALELARRALSLNVQPPR